MQDLLNLAVMAAKEAGKEISHRMKTNDKPAKGVVKPVSISEKRQ